MSRPKLPGNEEGSVQDIELLLGPLSKWSPSKDHSTFRTASTENKLLPPPTTLQYILKRTGSERLTGWRFGVIWCAVLAFLVFVLNFGITIWVASGLQVVNEVATVYEGPCSKTRSYLIWLHLAINVLSSLLLGASNYCMQILSSPTRKEIDAAHANRKWLSIGVPNLKNLLFIDRKKSSLWILLGLSSIPLHLVWNSAVLEDLSAGDYVYNVVAEDFVSGAPWDAVTNLTGYPEQARFISEKIRSSSAVNMSVAECISAYRVDDNAKYGTLALVYDVEGWNNSLLFQDSNLRSDPGRGIWMCGYTWDVGDYCDLDELIRENATDWNPWHKKPWGDPPWEPNKPHESYRWKSEFFIEGKVKYCLAEVTNRPCRLGTSPPILITVLVCNVVKFICFVLTFTFCRYMHPLVTNGDAVESFLSQPDTTLKGRCLLSKEDVKKHEHFWSEQPPSIQWPSKRRRWAAAASKSRWLATFIP